jgi:hypothetical protein
MMLVAKNRWVGFVVFRGQETSYILTYLTNTYKYIGSTSDPFSMETPIGARSSGQQNALTFVDGKGRGCYL